MGFEELLPSEKGEDEIGEDEVKSEKLENNDKIGQNQIYDIVTSRKSDWQAVIYDLIHTEQLDPLDIDLVLLTGRYFEKIQEMEEAEFYISSKVLLAAALLLRIKSEFLLNKYIRSIDEILFGKKEEVKIIERIEIDEDELPILIPKTPLPRSRRVTLVELMSALNKAINTESRRIKREVAFKRARKLSEVDFPKFRRIDLKDRIKQFYSRVLTFLRKKAIGSEKHLNKISYSRLIGKEKEEKLASFLPLLHLSNTRKLWLEQEEHLDEIWVYLYTYFSKNRDKFIEELEEDIEEMKEELGKEEGRLLEKDGDKKETEEGRLLEKDGDKKDSEGDEVSGLEKARRKREEKKKLEDEIKRELEAELKTEIKKEIEELRKDEKIEEVSGFDGERDF